MNAKNPKIIVKEIGKFKCLYIKSKPKKLLAKVFFDVDYISQKLVFTLMDITYRHGLSCAAPRFEEKEVIFSISVKASRWKYKSASRALLTCLEEIEKLSSKYMDQMDFTQVDISMFSGVNFETFYPEYLAAARDQYFNGSWQAYYDALIKEGRYAEADLTKKCAQFESLNKKDIALVGHKLVKLLFDLEKIHENFEVN
jgi:hypothetical protein